VKAEHSGTQHTNYENRVIAVVKKILPSRQNKLMLPHMPVEPMDGAEQ
jgi:hypothetical protein